jgi:hypothetical protein
LFLDADEVVPPDLAKEILHAIESKEFDGYYINRINYMYGIRLYHGQPDYQLRLFRREKGVYKNVVHETAIVNGPTAKLKNSFIHYSVRNAHEHVQKMNLYTDLSSAASDIRPVLFLKPFYRFLQNFFFKKAYKDGVAGLVLSLHSFFYECVVLIKVWERRYVKKSWYDFYKAVDSREELSQQAAVHKELIDSIMASGPRKLLEVGSGAASISMSIAQNKGVTLITVDNNLDILKKVHKSAQDLGITIKVVCADAFRLPFKESTFDSVFSQGLLEHFGDSDIKCLLSEQLRISSVSVTFSVPNRHYKHRDFGNERLLSKREWDKMLCGFTVLESRNYYALRTKRNFLRRLPLMYLGKIGKNA